MTHQGISDGYLWTIIFTLAVGTIAIRGSFIALSSRWRVSERMKEAFSFIPAAVLPAMAVPMVFYHQGQQNWLFGKERLVILGFATLVAIYTRRMTLTLAFGLVALYLANQF